MPRWWPLPRRRESRQDEQEGLMEQFHQVGNLDMPAAKPRTSYAWGGPQDDQAAMQQDLPIDETTASMATNALCVGYLKTEEQQKCKQPDFEQRKLSEMGEEARKQIQEKAKTEAIQEYCSSFTLLIKRPDLSSQCVAMCRKYCHPEPRSIDQDDFSMLHLLRPLDHRRGSPRWYE